jgi:glutamate-1-semialdehyde 2,1-aminomutase
VAGKSEIMELIAARRVVQAGTFNGNPVTLAAAEATLDALSRANGAALDRVRRHGELLMAGIRSRARETRTPLLVNGVGAAFHLSFTSRTEMRTYRDTLECDALKRDAFIVAMLERGVYLLSDGRWYISAAHDEADIQHTLAAVDESFSALDQQSN